MLDDQPIDISAYRRVNVGYMLESLPNRLGMVHLLSTPQNRGFFEGVEGVEALNGAQFEEWHHHVDIRPRPDKVDGNWSSGFSLDFGLGDFWTLFRLLQRIKAQHLEFLAGTLVEPGEIRLEELGQHLSFSSCYAWSSAAYASVTPCDKMRHFNQMRALCTLIDIDLEAGGQAHRIGSFSLYSAFACMAKLILETERVASVLRGEPWERVKAIELIDTGYVPDYSKFLDDTDRNKSGLYLVPVPPKTPIV
jgi:hypothetical protein